MRDCAGRRTYDTCYRADYIFGVEEAILVRQWFHLDRALYICDRLGLDAVGVAADRRDYYSARYWWWRAPSLAGGGDAGLAGPERAAPDTGVGGKAADSLGRSRQKKCLSKQ